MKKIISLAFVVTFFLFPFFTTAQNKEPSNFSKNTIHASFGTFLVLNSVHITYDRLLKTSKKGFFKAYYASAKVGTNAVISFAPGSSDSGHILAAGITGLTGTGKNHFELGLGLGAYINPENEEVGADFEPTKTSLFLNVSVGYRKQILKGLLFRTGLGITEWAYFGFGVSL